MDVAVVGAGIGGLALARALRGAGVGVRVFERARPRPDAAAGIQLSPNAVGPATTLGLGPALAEHAVAVEGIEVRSWRGDPIAWTPLGDACVQAYGAPYCTVHRADLHDALTALVGADLVDTGGGVAGVEQDDGGATVVLQDGTRHRADAVVGADGLHSTVRAHLSDDAPLASGLVALRALVDVAELPPGARTPRVRVWHGPGAHLVCYPVSAGRALSVTAVVREDDSLARFEGWHAPVQMLTRAAGPLDRRALHDREPLTRWVRGRVTVLGDAAHPMLPFLAQGAGQAVEDAVDLAGRLASATDPVPHRLARYADARAERTAGLVRAAREHARVSHLPDGPRQRERDADMRHGAGLAQRGWLYGHAAA